jgi:hypothetical protein
MENTYLYELQKRVENRVDLFSGLFAVSGNGFYTYRHVLILCLSCNVKSPNQLLNCTERSRSNRRSITFQVCLLSRPCFKILLLVLPYDRSTRIRFQENAIYILDEKRKSYHIAYIMIAG